MPLTHISQELPRENPLNHAKQAQAGLSLKIKEAAEILLKELGEYDFPEEHISSEYALKLKAFMDDFAKSLQRSSNVFADGLIGHSEYVEALSLLLKNFYYTIRLTPLDYTINPHSPLAACAKRVAKEIKDGRPLVNVIMPSVRDVIGGVIGNLVDDTEEEGDIEFGRFILSEDGVSLIDIETVVNMSISDPAKLLGDGDRVFPLTDLDRVQLKEVSADVCQAVQYVEEQYIHCSGATSFYAYLSRLHLGLKASSIRGLGSEYIANFTGLKGPLTKVFAAYRHLESEYPEEFEKLKEFEITTAYGKRNLNGMLLYLFSFDADILESLTKEEYSEGMAARTFPCTHILSGQIHEFLLDSESEFLKSIDCENGEVASHHDRARPAEIESSAISERTPAWRLIKPIEDFRLNWDFYIKESQITFEEDLYTRCQDLAELVEAYQNDLELDKYKIMSVLSNKKQREHIVRQSQSFALALYARLSDDVFMRQLPVFDNQPEAQWHFIMQLSPARQQMYLETVPVDKLKDMLNLNDRYCLEVLTKVKNELRLCEIIYTVDVSLIANEATFVEFYQQLPESLRLHFLIKNKPAASWLSSLVQDEANTLYLRFIKEFQHMGRTDVDITRRLLTTYVIGWNALLQPKKQVKFIRNFLQQLQEKQYNSALDILRELFSRLIETFSQAQIKQFKPNSNMMSRIRMIAALAGVTLDEALDHAYKAEEDDHELYLFALAQQRAEPHNLVDDDDEEEEDDDAAEILRAAILQMHGQIRDQGLQPVAHAGFFAHNDQEQLEPQDGNPDTPTNNPQ